MNENEVCFWHDVIPVRNNEFSISNERVNDWHEDNWSGKYFFFIGRSRLARCLIYEDQWNNTELLPSWEQAIYR